ncbi:hypothetical protein AB6G95_19330 [Proteus vulgaris]|uniref:hypothetical protein n=1 Tax=Proteus vulgaris TaxID=585 RepID=UPI0034DD0487
MLVCPHDITVGIAFSVSATTALMTGTAINRIGLTKWFHVYPPINMTGWWRGSGHQP